MDKKQFQDEFKKTLDNMYLIMLKKNADYAKTDPFGNFKLVEELGITNVEKGILVRIADKISRITNLIDKEAQVKDESIEDTLQDLANYAVILKIYLKLWKKCAEHDKAYSYSIMKIWLAWLSETQKDVLKSNLQISKNLEENKTKNKFTVDEKYKDLLIPWTESYDKIWGIISLLEKEWVIKRAITNWDIILIDNINDYISKVMLKWTTTN